MFVILQLRKLLKDYHRLDLQSPSARSPSSQPSYSLQARSNIKLETLIIKITRNKLRNNFMAQMEETHIILTAILIAESHTPRSHNTRQVLYPRTQIILRKHNISNNNRAFPHRSLSRIILYTWIRLWQTCYYLGTKAAIKLGGTMHCAKLAIIVDRVARTTCKCKLCRESGSGL